MLTVSLRSRCRDLRHRDASQEELRRYFADREQMFVECARQDIRIDDYLEYSPIQWPARWLPEREKPVRRYRRAP